MAPRVSQKGFPVALHREDVGNKVHCVLSTFLLGNSKFPCDVKLTN